MSEENKLSGAMAVKESAQVAAWSEAYRAKREGRLAEVRAAIAALQQQQAALQEEMDGAGGTLGALAVVVEQSSPAVQALPACSAGQRPEVRH
jgi:hypothetical protein